MRPLLSEPCSSRVRKYRLDNTKYPEVIERFRLLSDGGKRDCQKEQREVREKVKFSMSFTIFDTLLLYTKTEKQSEIINSSWLL